MAAFTFTKLQRGMLHAWVMLLVLLLFPYTSDPASPPKEFATAVAVLAVGACAVWTAFAGRRPLHLRTPAIVLTLLLLLAFAATGLLSAAPAASFFALHRWALLFLLLVYTAQLFRDPAPVWRLLTTIVLAISLSSIYGLLQHFGVDPFPWVQREIEEYRGLPSTYGNPNFAGHALVLGVVVAAGLLLAKRAWWGILPLALMITHLYLAHMRSGPLALAAAAALAALALAVGRTRIRAKAQVTLAALVLLGAAGVAALFAVQYFQTGSPLPADSSLVLRINGYYGATQMLLDKPLSGHGPGQYVTEAPAYWTDYEQAWFARRGQRNSHVHNDLLEAGVDAGMAGMLLYIALFAYAIVAGLRLFFSGEDIERRRLGLVLACAFAAFAVDGQFGFNLHVPVSAGLLFLLLGILESLRLHGPAGTRWSALKPLIILLLASVAAAQAARQFAAEIFFQRGNGALYHAQDLLRQRPPEAAQYFLSSGYQQLARARQILPWQPRFSRALGALSLEQRQFERAIHHFEEALRLQPHDPGLLLQAAQAHANLALTFAAEQGDVARVRAVLHLDEAEARAREALSLSAYLDDAREVLGRVAIMRAQTTANPEESRRHFREAAQFFEEALLRGAQRPAEILLLLAQAQVNLGDSAAAEQTLRNAIDADPTALQVWPLFDRLVGLNGAENTYFAALNLALDLLKREQQPDARAVAEVEARLGRYYLSHARADLAALFLLNALQAVPARLDIWRSYAEAQPVIHRLAALEEAIARLDPVSVPEELIVVSDLDDATPEALLQRAQQLAEYASMTAQQATPEEVYDTSGWLAAVLLQSLERHALPPRERGQTMTFLGSALLDAGHALEANDVFVRALALLPEAERAIPLMLRSRAQAELGDDQIALSLAREAARLAPEHRLVRVNLARQLLHHGLLAEANLEYLGLLAHVGWPAEMREKLEREHEEVLRQLEATEAAP